MPCGLRNSVTVGPPQSFSAKWFLDSRRVSSSQMVGVVRQRWHDGGLPRDSTGPGAWGNFSWSGNMNLVTNCEYYYKQVIMVHLLHLQSHSLTVSSLFCIHLALFFRSIIITLYFNWAVLTAIICCLQCSECDYRLYNIFCCSNWYICSSAVLSSLYLCPWFCVNDILWCFFVFHKTFSNFYRAMHYSAKCSIGIARRPSVCLSVHPWRWWIRTT